MMSLDVLLVMALLVVSDHDFFRICIVLLKNPDIYYLEKNLRSNLAWDVINDRSYLLFR